MKHFGVHFGLCLLRRFPFLVDPGTGIPIKNDLLTLGKRSANCVALVKQDLQNKINGDLQGRVQWVLLIKGLRFRSTQTKTWGRLRFRTTKTKTGS